jgi:hypothetical protein
MRNMRTLPGLSVLLALTLVAVAAVHAQQTFVPLFDGTLKGWVVENSTANNFTIKDGALRVEAPSGWLRSERQFTDFTMRIRFRFLTADADSGVFFRTTGATQFMRGWPNNAYQVQLRNPATKSFLPAAGGLFRHGMPPGELTYDQPAVEKLSRGTNEWQDLEFTVSGETLTVRFNGSEVTRAGNIVRQPGYVGLQAEVGALEFRSIEVSTSP